MPALLCIRCTKHHRFEDDAAEVNLVAVVAVTEHRVTVTQEGLAQVVVVPPPDFPIKVHTLTHEGAVLAEQEVEVCLWLLDGWPVVREG